MKTPIGASAFALALLIPFAASAQVSLMVNIAPPPLPVYAQPMVPGDGYIWTPGYWAWNASADDYYWVPGTWVLAPGEGQLWTPGYWAFGGTGYFWNVGYWGTQVGYYGGINYGYGYTGNGYQGGRWDGRNFRYNAAVSHVDTRVTHNTYSTRAVNYAPAARTSYSAAKAGAAARPTAQAQGHGPVEAAHGAPTPEQVQHEHAALAAPTQRAWVPHGPPQVAATARPSGFTAPGVEHVRAEPAAHAPQAQRTQAPREQAPRPQAQAQRPQAPREQPAARSEQPHQEAGRGER